MEKVMESQGIWRTQKVRTLLLSRHFSPRFDHGLLYHDRYTFAFEFSQGHVIKNQLMVVPVLSENLGMLQSWMWPLLPRCVNTKANVPRQIASYNAVSVYCLVRATRRYIV